MSLQELSGSDLEVIKSQIVLKVDFFCIYMRTEIFSYLVVSHPERSCDSHIPQHECKVCFTMSEYPSQPKLVFSKAVQICDLQRPISLKNYLLHLYANLSRVENYRFRSV